MLINTPKKNEENLHAKSTIEYETSCNILTNILIEKKIKKNKCEQ